jgi:hypothetical protein
MSTELCIKYFCNIKLCCMWRFDDNISVIYKKMACAYILFYVYCFNRAQDVWYIFSILCNNSVCSNC